ncbi:MAG TPA: cell envelope integrity protein TolA [Steroidobacteraceae bacterium]|nr:cell envelope integrity protein TolA [Steroidobacteraceae bacterium]
MSQRRRSFTQGRWRAIALSVLLHSGIVAAAVYGWFTWKTRAPPPVTLAIEGTVVDARALKSPAPKPEPPPPQPEPAPEPTPEPEEQGPPEPDPAELERRKEEERLAQEKLEQEKQQKEQQEKERLEAEKQAAQKKEAEKAAAEKAAAEKAAAEKKAAEKKAADKKKADEAAAKKAAEEKARQAELLKALEAEERGNAVRNSDAAARWYASIVAKIERAWIKPASAQPGVTCIVAVSQVPGGDVTSVQVRSCSINDPALRQSVENAVYSASPLPQPPDPALFERNLELTFAPTK